MKTILIANRGEIALRIMRSARRLGYRCVAVYSDADAQAAHVRTADAACRIGPGPARASYLDMKAVLDAAATLGVDAVHPGYGFLAENAEFAQAVLAAGFVWIGPPPAAMRAMGNKAGAKRLLAGRGVPLLPGYQGGDQDAETLLREAERIGLPLMIKAAAGGGGRGMRLVREHDEIADAIARARSEAEQAFGSGELILERALTAPRHVEVQVFGDTFGNLVHLGERDCSVQRRHQKLIEEAPSPAVDRALRARLGAAAVEAARACDYVGAGTIEFLLDADGKFWFMEMNTRLQVEHPVTEAITGLDLVEWQLRVAEGEALPLSQAEIDARLAGGGHAIEVRLCAEDPALDFLPQSGTVLAWRAPGGLRVEHALSDGAQVPPYYDSMIAKLIAHGATREEARRKLAAGLEECRLVGLASNQDFLHDCLAHPEFAAGKATTDFIARYFPPQAVAVAPEWPTLCAATAALLLQRTARLERRYPQELAGWSSVAPFEDELIFELDGMRQTVNVRAAGPLTWTLRAAGDESGRGAESTVQVEPAAQGICLLRIGEHAVGVCFAADGDRIWLRFSGRNHWLRDLGCQPARSAAAARGGGTVRAPMSGKVALVHVREGAAVDAGQALLVLEAMKMEHTLLAPVTGIVERLYVGSGDQATPGMVLATLKTEAGQ